MQQQISQSRQFVKSIHHLDTPIGQIGVEIFFAGRQAILKSSDLLEILGELFATEVQLGTYGLTEGELTPGGNIEITFLLGSYQQKDDLDAPERFIVMTDRLDYWNQPHIVQYFNSGTHEDRLTVPWAAFFEVLGEVLTRPYYAFDSIELVLGQHKVIHPKQIGYH